MVEREGPTQTGLMRFRPRTAGPSRVPFRAPERPEPGWSVQSWPWPDRDDGPVGDPDGGDGR